MRLLVDTHAMLWFASDSPELSKKARKFFLDKDNEIYFSMASIWELSIKLSLKKLKLAVPLREFIETTVVANKISILEIKSSHLFKLTSLPYLHRDPFDRLLVTQSMEEDLKILSKDTALKKYDISCVW